MAIVSAHWHVPIVTNWLPVVPATAHLWRRGAARSRGSFGRIARPALGGQSKTPQTGLRPKAHLSRGT
jgi:hypothetical protein